MSQRSRSPSLPLPPKEYNKQYFEQLLGTLRLFFSQLDSWVASIQGPRGTRFLNAPYGAFSDATDQTAASTTVAYAMTFNTTDGTQGVALGSPTSRITVEDAGTYNLQFSAQFVNTDTAIHDVDVWFAVNGANVGNSNSRFSIPNSHGGIDGHLIAALNFLVTMNASDYVEIMWCTNNTSVSIQHLASAVSPTRPATPSVIATMTFVSNTL
jgi:hypothetical protein